MSELNCFGGRYQDNPHPAVRLVEHRLVFNDLEMKTFADQMIKEGYEGLVLRDPEARYKQGRSTDQEGSFLRFVPWHSGEAIILGVSEGYINLNESKVNELGNLKKSSHKENKVPSGRAGTSQVMDLKTNVEFSMLVPTVALQEAVWSDPKAFIGKIAKYNYKDSIKGNMPRFAQYQGLRAKIDM